MAKKKVRHPPVNTQRADGFVNVLNKYGSNKDSSEAFQFVGEGFVSDDVLTTMYENSGLFSVIIDTPAEEALKHGFDLGWNEEEISSYLEESLDILDWEEKASTALKWSRLYGGAIIVMLIDDGGNLEDPVDYDNIKEIEELRVYERPLVQPDYHSMYSTDGYLGNGKRKTSRFGMPEFYDVSSIYGTFRVHESRCLVFRNGTLPERTMNATYRFWGLPEYNKVRRALQDTVVGHESGVKLLMRSVQAIYKMKGLASNLTSEQGENDVLKRLELIDMARGIFGSIAIDAEGEDYDFRTFQFSGVKDVIDASCNMLSAVTRIPQNVLFGKSTTGMSATDDTSMENYYNYIEKIQKMCLKRNFCDVIDLVLKSGLENGDISEIPKYKLKFNPLWNMSDTEKATIEKTKADTKLVTAQTAQIYVDMQAYDPSEVRKALASSGEFNVENLVDLDSMEDDVDDLEGLLSSLNQYSEEEPQEEEPQEEEFEVSL